MMFKSKYMNKPRNVTMLFYHLVC